LAHSCAPFFDQDDWRACGLAPPQVTLGERNEQVVFRRLKERSDLTHIAGGRAFFIALAGPELLDLIIPLSVQTELIGRFSVAKFDGALCEALRLPFAADAQLDEVGLC
jgi:hypothetical protein